MPINDFITTALNISEDDIEELDTRSDDRDLIITLKL